jgi:hypothetical protein
LVGYVSRGGIKETTFHVEAAGEGATLIIRVKGEMKGLLRLAEPLVVRLAPRHREWVMAKMKERLEARAENAGEA